MNSWRSALEIYQHAAGYQPAEFVVSSLDYYPETGSGRSRSPAAWYALGRIGEQDERFNLEGYLTHEPKSIEDLRSQMAMGSRLAVLYNPEVHEATSADKAFECCTIARTLLSTPARASNIGRHSRSCRWS